MPRRLPSHSRAELVIWASVVWVIAFLVYALLRSIYLWLT